MTRTVTLQATAKHPTRKEGEQYEVEGGKALLDLALRRAIAYRAPKEPREILHLQTKKKRAYKRRDMTAE